MKSLWNDLINNAWGKFFWHWGFPFLIGGITIPFAHNPYMPQLAAAASGMITSASFDRKWYIVFIKLLWFVGAYGYSGYLYQFGFTDQFSGPNGAVQAIAILAGIVGLVTLPYWCWLGVIAIGGFLKRILLFWRKPNKTIKLRYIVFLAIAGGVAYIGYSGGLASIITPGSSATSGTEVAIIALIILGVLVGIVRAGWWVILGGKETLVLMYKCLQTVMDTQPFHKKVTPLLQGFSHFFHIGNHT